MPLLIELPPPMFYTAKIRASASGVSGKTNAPAIFSPPPHAPPVRPYDVRRPFEFQLFSTNAPLPMLLPCVRMTCVEPLKRPFFTQEGVDVLSTEKRRFQGLQRPLRGLSVDKKREGLRLPSLPSFLCGPMLLVLLQLRSVPLQMEALHRLVDALFLEEVHGVYRGHVLSDPLRVLRLLRRGGEELLQPPQKRDGYLEAYCRRRVF